MATVTSPPELEPTFGIEQIAEHFGITPEQVVRRCSSALNPWPHLRPNQRKSSTWRFTREDVEAIETRIRARETAVDSWGRTHNKKR